MSPNGDQRKEANWHLDKTISVTHIFSTVIAITTLVVLGSRFDTRLTVLENNAVNERQANIQQDEDMNLLRREVREDFREISNKLERLLNKVNQ